MFNKSYTVAAAHFIGTALAFKLLYYILPSIITDYYFFLANIVLFSFLSWSTLFYTKHHFLKDKINPLNKAVFITGCDTGFGHNLAKRLDSKGYVVFASCLFPSGDGANELRKSCSSNLKVVELDVTKDESVENAVNFVKQNIGDSVLWAIVNNAGIGKGLSVDYTKLKEFQDSVEVNVYGSIRVTKAFLSFLKKSKGRVVNITSIAGRVCTPHAAPYMVSKHAAVGFSDALRQELVDWNISVVSIEPELFKTALIKKENIEALTDSTFSNIDADLKDEYDEEYQKNFKWSESFFISWASSNISIVIDDIESAISLKYPDSVYNPRRNIISRMLLFVFVASPIPIRDFIVKVSLMVLRYKKPRRSYKIL